jgi:hypothetical protein
MATYDTHGFAKVADRPGKDHLSPYAVAVAVLDDVGDTAATLGRGSRDIYRNPPPAAADWLPAGGAVGAPETHPATDAVLNAVTANTDSSFFQPMTVLSQGLR